MHRPRVCEGLSRDREWKQERKWELKQERERKQRERKQRERRSGAEA